MKRKNRKLVDRIFNGKSKTWITLFLALVLVIPTIVTLSTTVHGSAVGLSKDTHPSDLEVKPGDVVTYYLDVYNPDAAKTMTLTRIWDVYPDGSEATLATNVVLDPGEHWIGTTTYTVTGSEPLVNGKIVNTLRCTGYDSSGDDVNGMVTKSNRLIVPELPRPRFIWELICESRDVRFDASGSYDPDGTIVSYTWDFGDGSTGTGENVVHTYTADGTYHVTLTVCDNDGLCNSETKDVVVSWMPCNVCKLRLYGTFGEGAGDFSIVDPETGLQPENKPYTDPMGPFYPQHDQSPRKDFITFNPAIMDHNQGYPELSYYTCDDNDVQREGEKVFQRMWYEKEWFKDDDMDGCWDIVLQDPAGNNVPFEICNTDDLKTLHDNYLANGYTILEHNNDPSIGDVYGPAIVKEYTYMAVNVSVDGDYVSGTPFANLPVMIRNGSKVLIPMASYSSDDGIDSFDADGDGVRDAVKVESENTLGIDIDQDGIKEKMDNDGVELSGDETVVFVLRKYMEVGDTIQFFDNKVELKDVFELGDGGQAILKVMDNEGGGSQRYTDDVTLKIGDHALFYRGEQTVTGTNFYVKLISADASDNKAIVEVGRLFGKPYANIGANVDWNQKAFIVDGVFYNIVAIKTIDDCFKYITIREKLPKMPIKIYGKHLEVWDPNEILPELPPFNDAHEIIVDIEPTWTIPQNWKDKIGEKIERPAMEIKYISESIEERYKGELKEIYAETLYGDFNPTYGDSIPETTPGMHDESWLMEWFYTYPDQYTEFVLPKDELYLVTLSWFAPEACYHIWDGSGEDNPISAGLGNRVKFWYGDCTGPLYVTDHGIRVFGTFGEGAGDLTAIDPDTYLQPENKPYTDPMGPFYPQHDQSPRKDFITFNPAIMDHNQGYPELSYYTCDDNDVQREGEKVFQRMWYEKEWFKDDDMDGCWDIVLQDPAGNNVPFEICNTDDLKTLHDNYLANGYTILEHNNDPSIGDVYGPAIVKEYTYMAVNVLTEGTYVSGTPFANLPVMIKHGSEVLIPMASYSSDDGIDSFDADGDGVRDAVKVESENTLGIDIDQDGIKEKMDNDGVELSGDETVVFVLRKYMEVGDTIQFFDNKVELKDVFELGDTGHAIFDITDNEGGGSQRHTDDVTLKIGDHALFYRGEQADVGTNFYVKLISADASDNKAIVEVGRLFGKPYANIGANVDWNQKAFIVDGVFYNIVAIKTIDDCFKYITIREKLPKMPIKIYGKHLEVWDPNEILPELPPFNDAHEIIVDIEPTWTIPDSVFDKIGPKVQRPAMEVTYTEEDIEERYLGELKEIYFEKISEMQEHEGWLMEWFYTYPDQYTVFTLPEGELYLMTLSWFAPEACYHIWDGGGEDNPISAGFGSRVKFWYDPADPVDIYINRMISEPVEKPDLIVSDIIINECPTACDCELTFTVSNIGDGAAGPFDITITLPDDSTIEQTCDGLNPGVSTAYTVSVDCMEGIYEVEVDSNHAIEETDETNNQGAYYYQPSPGELCGDVNCDGSVNTGDVIILLNHVTDAESYPLCDDWAGDVNCDGSVNTGDVILLLNHITHPTDPRYELSCCTYS